MAVLCCMLAKKLFPRIVKYSRFNMDVAIDWLPVNLLFIAMLMTGFFSLKALAVPMVTIFKNLTNVAILAGDWSGPAPCSLGVWVPPVPMPLPRSRGARDVRAGTSTARW